MVSLKAFLTDDLVIGVNTFVTKFDFLSLANLEKNKKICVTNLTNQGKDFV